jgi:uncharacterized protein
MELMLPGEAECRLYVRLPPSVSVQPARMSSIGPSADFQSGRARASRPVSPVGLAAAAAAVVAALLAARAAGAGENDAVETFVLVFSSIVIEALPFVLMGALVAAGIAVLVPDRAFDRVAGLPLPLQLPALALSGMAFPVCECGSVPVARRLILRGIHPAAGLGFMLSAPIVNPIVLLSTWVAYSGRGLGTEMVAGRAGLGLVVAVSAGWALGRAGPALLRARPADRDDHEHAHGRRRERFVDHLADDFLFMGKFLVLGAAVAAALQTAIPQSVVSGVADTQVLSVLALMGLAFMLSLCSEADAFVAVSFAGFPIAAQLGFLVFGPIVDTKLAALYGAVFRPGFALKLALVAAPLVLVGSLLFEAAAL